MSLPAWTFHFAYAALLLTCVAAAWFDVRTSRVPNALTYFAMLGGLSFWAVAGQGTEHSWYPLGYSFIAALAALVPMAALVLMGGLGGGDMKLMGAVGAITATWEAVLGTAVYALLIAAGMAIVTMIRRGIVKETLARVVGAAAMASSRVKPELPDATDPQTAAVPFAVAIAIGAAISGAEHLLGWQPPWTSW